MREARRGYSSLDQKSVERSLGSVLDSDDFEEGASVLLPHIKDTNSNIIKRLGANKNIQIRAFLKECL